ncbi:MAG TPA: hypothetical protein VLG36_06345 [Candidatus Chromulinivoraceae bacterium]|nr:hypothetical protein [Candidatus Chromulinivoraceae bacterium]
MSEHNDQLAAESTREATTLAGTLLNGDVTEAQHAFAEAANRPARWIEKPYKQTTLAAVFVIDHTAAIVRGYPESKRQLLAALVFEDVATLRQIHNVGGSVPRIAELLQPYTELSEEEVRERLAAVK